MMQRDTGIPERRPRFTAERKRLLLELIARGHTLTSACRTLGLSRNTVRLHSRPGSHLHDPEFADGLQRAEAARERVWNEEDEARLARHDGVQAAMYRAALAGDFRAQRYLLVLWTRHLRLDDPRRFVSERHL